MTTGVLVMAYGTASGPDDVERYYTDIRGGRPPTPELLAELKDRYAQIGNFFGLAETTTAQAEGLVERLGPDYRAYVGFKHSAPFIPETVARMRDDGIEKAVAIVMTPLWAGMSVDTYIAKIKEELEENGGPEFTYVKAYSEHPAFLEFLTGRVKEGLAKLTDEERRDMMVIFSAHSLPVRTEPDGSQRCKYCHACETQCGYFAGLKKSADDLAARVGIDADHYMTAWQSAGRTADPWWGPPIEQVLADLAAEGRSATLVCSVGFVADHLEILYDLDILGRGIAEEGGMAFSRTRMPNADPEYLDVLGAVVRDHLSANPL